MDNKIYEAEIKDIPLNNTPNGWDKQDFMGFFDFETAAFNKPINMFERMEVLDYICEGIGKPSTEKLTRLDANNYCFKRTMNGRYAFKKITQMGQSEKRKTRYEEYPSGELAPNFYDSRKWTPIRIL